MKIRMSTEIKHRLGMAAAVIVTLFIGLFIFYRHWQFELPGYPNVDEQLSLDCIYELMDQHLYAGDIYVLDFFRYPHLTFYYAVIGARILGKFFAGIDTDILLRYAVCGIAMLSNVCMYFSVKKMTGSRRIAYMGFALSVFSLYGFSYLFYTGPDTMMYAVANVILLLGVSLYQEKDEERAVYLWYPLLAICIGLAMAAKYHGILFGVFWLALHIKKKYWKSYRDNFVFFICCIVLALVFCVCNFSLFFHFKTFVWENLYNLNHYAWGHPGIEHNLPFLGYMEAFTLSSYGVMGGVLFLLGIFYLIRKKDRPQLLVFLLMPAVILLVLSRYQIVLGRNLSLIVPYAVLFMSYGLLEAETLFSKYLYKVAKKVTPDKLVTLIVALLILANITVVCNSYRYGLTYSQAANYIEEQIPAGSIIYCTDFAPTLDEDKYRIIRIGEDISLLPDADVTDSEVYYVDVEYATGYFRQKKDYLLWQGDYMYPEKQKTYEDKLSHYTLMQDFQGISYGKEWKFRAGYLDLFRYSADKYYVGPSIGIYH